MVLQRFRFLFKPTNLGLALIAVLFLVNLSVSEWNVRQLIENEHRVARTQETLTTLEEVLDSVTRAEATERGYLITQDASYLYSHDKAVRTAVGTLERLRTLTADNPLQQSRIDELQTLIRERFDELAHAISLRRDEGFEAATTRRFRQSRQAVDETGAQSGRRDARRAARDAGCALAGVAPQRGGDVPVRPGGRPAGHRHRCGGVLPVSTRVEIPASRRRSHAAAGRDCRVLRRCNHGLDARWNHSLLECRFATNLRIHGRGNDRTACSGLVPRPTGRTNCEPTWNESATAHISNTLKRSGCTRAAEESTCR